MTPPQIGDYVFYSSKDLDKNMRAAGRVRPPSTEAHHIVAETSRFATTARILLAAAGIGIDDAENGVYLVANSKVYNTSSAIHKKLHTGKYYREIERRLRIPGPGGVVGELQRIGRELEIGTFKY